MSSAADDAVNSKEERGEDETRPLNPTDPPVEGCLRHVFNVTAFAEKGPLLDFHSEVKHVSRDSIRDQSASLPSLLALQLYLNRLKSKKASSTRRAGYWVCMGLHQCR